MRFRLSGRGCVILPARPFPAAQRKYPLSHLTYPGPPFPHLEAQPAAPLLHRSLGTHLGKVVIPRADLARGICFGFSGATPFLQGGSEAISAVPRLTNLALTSYDLGSSPAKTQPLNRRKH